MERRIADLADHLADNLRAVRELRGLSQSQLSALCGIPRSTLANIESGGSNPTLSVLVRISAAMGVSLEELLAPPRVSCQKFPRGTLPILKKGRGATATVHKLLPHPTPGMEIDRIELTVGGVLPGVPHRPGTHEYLYCEAGDLVLWVSGERFDLSAGDVASFAGDQRHSYRNGGKRVAVGFSVVSLAPVAPQ